MKKKTEKPKSTALKLTIKVRYEKAVAKKSGVWHSEMSGSFPRSATN